MDNASAATIYTKINRSVYKVNLIVTSHDAFGRDTMNSNCYLAALCAGVDLEDPEAKRIYNFELPAELGKFTCQNFVYSSII